MIDQREAAFCATQWPGTQAVRILFLSEWYSCSLSGITVTIPMQGSRPQRQSRSPNYLFMLDYQVPKQDHRHQHPCRTFGHTPEQKSWMPLLHRTPSSYPRARTLAATPVWTLIYQCGAPPVAFILGLCSNRDSPLQAVPWPACTKELHIGSSHSWNHTLHATELSLNTSPMSNAISWISPSHLTPHHWKQMPPSWSTIITIFSGSNSQFVTLPWQVPSF